MKQFEVTLDEWREIGFDAQPRILDCAKLDCPVGEQSWFKAITFANALSLAHDPPLERCYVAEECGPFHQSFSCEEFKLNTESVYECEGYRLPTRAEWQYAARAGTVTSYYSGPMVVTAGLEDQGCHDDPNLDPVAWYSSNSSQQTHPVGQKLPNNWGLYDVLGNADEWLHDRDLARSPEAFVEDPFGELGIPQDPRPTAGGNAIHWPSLLRIAAGLQFPAHQGSSGRGFRLARTLGKGTLPTLDDIPAENRPSAQ